VTKQKNTCDPYFEYMDATLSKNRETNYLITKITNTQDWWCTWK